MKRLLQKTLEIKGYFNGKNNCSTANWITNRRPEKQRKTVIGLGLNKMHKTRELEDTPSVRGMVNKIPHLVKIIEERG